MQLKDLRLLALHRGLLQYQIAKLRKYVSPEEADGSLTPFHAQAWQRIRSRSIMELPKGAAAAARAIINVINHFVVRG